MAKQDKELFEEIEKVYNTSALALNELAAEVVTVEGKYGTESKITKKKKEQLESFRTLHDKTIVYINYLRELNDAMVQKVFANELIRHQRHTGLPFSSIIALAGGDPGPWDKVDKNDQILSRIRKAMNVNEADVEFEDFIKSLRVNG